MLSWLLTVPVSAVAERLFPEHRAARARAQAGTPDTA